MLADIEVNATVYVQPTSRSVVHSPHRLRIYCYDIACVCEQKTVANWRTAGPRHVRRCGNGCVLVPFLAGSDEASEAQLHQRRDHGAREMRTAVMREYVPYFLLQVLQAHGLACKLGDEVARRLCRRAQTQVAKQVEQLFEHLPPTTARRSAGRVAPSLPPALSVP
jgi:hypothetical protein